MADPALVPKGKVEFIQFHRPALEAGDYTITVKQKIENEKITSKNCFTLSKPFSVLGPRFSLDPQLIHSVFPPAGSLGEHSNVLPHIMLKRSTLPWERRVNETFEDVPWLALLVFAESEAPKPQEASNKQQTITLADLKNREGEKFPQIVEREGNPTESTYLKLEYGQHHNDQLAVIDVQWADLKDMLPPRADLELLAHVRRGKDANGNLQGDELAVIIANRLPIAGGQTTVHLVSLEGLYNSEGAFIYKCAQETDYIRLISLYSWRFACLAEKQSFKGLLLHLNHHLLLQVRIQDELQQIKGLGPKSEALLHGKGIYTFRQLASLDVSTITQWVEGTTVQHLDEQSWVDQAKKYVQDENDIILQAVKEGFAAINRPLSAPTIADIGGWQINDSGLVYLIGQNKRVYTQVGKFLFSIETDLTNAGLSYKYGPIPQRLADEFKGKGHHLEQQAQIRTGTDEPAWWMTDDSKQLYFLRQEGLYEAYSYIYVYEIDLDTSNTLRLPKLSDKAEPYLSQGYTPLPHAMRQGNQTVSWYHGPLLPGQNPTETIDLPVRAADALVRYNPGTGMFDPSYAAAWELGRLLALQNKRVSVDLFNWKRSHVMSLKEAENQLAHLPIQGQPIRVGELPQNVQDWFYDLSLLKNVPFNYLVPDERMLPAETIRYFWIDPLWIECLLDGAFSVGRVSAGEQAQDTAHRTKGLAPTWTHPVVSGFLLRSAVVSGWPDLQVDGYSEVLAPEQLREFDYPLSQVGNAIDFTQTLKSALDKGNAEAIQIIANAFPFPKSLDPSRAIIYKQSDTTWLINVDENRRVYLIKHEDNKLHLYHENKLPLLRMERLSKNVLICLFEGELKMVDIHQKPEALHFGVSRPDEDHGNEYYYRQLRNLKGEEQSWYVTLDPDKWNNEAKHILNITSVMAAIQAELKKQGVPIKPDSAQFALQMIEGVQKVRFVGQNSSSLS